ncbi:MAG: mycofactocin biosynthesis chaperone MftB [Acidimicrobiales bacterium]
MACAGSTELIESPARRPGVDVHLAYELHPDVAMRPEPFGALAYHYGNRRLNFLRSRRLADLVGSLGSHGSVIEALDAAEIPVVERASIEAALGSLLASEVIRAR